MKKTLRLLALLPCCMSIAFIADAKPLTPGEAVNRALGSPSVRMMKKAPKISGVKLAHTFNVSESDATPMVYVFNKGGGDGFIMTPADDSFPAVLGYGDSGIFDAAKVSPAMLWFMEGYAKEMAWTLENDPDYATRAEASDDSWTPVAPLLKSKWDQGLPYSLMSPTLDVTDSDGAVTQKVPTVTGCVATSLAQVMYYHKWPDVGVGSNSYDWGPYRDVVQKKLSCDFSKCKFAWDDMLDKYEYDAQGNPTWTDAQANAVAELMYACGISVNMNYNMEQAGGSGAVSRDQGHALVENFKYSRALRYKYRDYCTSSEFEKIIYDNLKEGLPVLYNGRGDAGGHSFVCDGYAGRHYFHFNWGWSGVSDGYFYLARLNPSSLGIGGATGGFNSNQGISYNIRPVKDGVDTGTEEAPYFICCGNFTFSNQRDDKSNNGQVLTFSVFKVKDPVTYTEGFWNMSVTPFTGYLGVIVKDETGNETFVPGLTCENVPNGSGFKEVSAYLEEFPEGRYTIYPGYYDTKLEDGDYIRVVNGYNDHVYMTVAADGSRSFVDGTKSEGLTTAPEMAVTSFNYSGKVYANQAHDFLMTVANYSPDTDYYGGLTMVLKDSKGRELSTMPLGRYDLPAGQTLPLSFSLTLDLQLKMDFTVSFRDAFGRDLPGDYPLEVAGKGNELKTDLRVMAFSPTDVEPHSSSNAVTIRIGNYGSKDIIAPKFSVGVFKVGETQGKGWTFSYPSLTMQSNYIYNLSVSLPFDLEEGEYNVQVTYYKKDADGNDTDERELISSGIMLRSGYPVSSLEMEEDDLEMNPGESARLLAKILPENATFRILTWTSSNPSCVTVDNTGSLKAVAPGHAYVTVTAYNGISTTRKVLVKGGSSGVESIGVDECEEILAVYTVSGSKILESPTPAQMDALAKGIYIVVTQSGSHKLVK